MTFAKTRSFAVATLLGISLPSQELAPSPLRPHASTTAVAANSGLRANPDGPGLHGGGRDYDVWLDRQGMRFVPALGANCPSTQHLALTPTAVRVGETTVVGTFGEVLPTMTERTGSYAHAAGIVERFDVRPDGVDLAWQFAQPLGNGELVVRYAVDTTLGEPTPVNGGLEFLGDHGGVRIGGVTGIDARGARAAGSLRWASGHVEMALPASFVATAAYPLTLDPLIGTLIPVSFTLPYADSNPDTEWSDYGQYLVVWQRAFSATSQAIRGQFVDDETGALVGSTVFFNSAGIASGPRVSYLPAGDDFGVVWTQTSGTTHSVQFQAFHMQPPSGLLTPMTIASSTTAGYSSAAIGSDFVGSFTVVYEDETLDAIRRRVLSYVVGGGLTMNAAASIWSDALPGPSYHQPAISRHAYGNDRLLAVARQYDPVNGTSAIVGRFLDGAGGAYSLSTPIVTSTGNDLFAPAVDGFDSRWVVAWERAGSGLVWDAVRMRTVDFGFALGATVTIGGTAASRASAPTVCYAPSRTWIGYQSVSLSSTTLRLAAVGSDNCVSCNETYVTPNPPSGSRIVATRRRDPGFAILPFEAYGDEALVVFDDSIDDIGGQRVTDVGTTGSVQELGGGCGPHGIYTPSPTPPTIGRRYTDEYVAAAPGLVVYNLSPVVGTIPCGPCEFVPLSATLTPMPFFFYNFVEFPVPCQPGLVGAQLLSQWVVLDFAATQTPCALVPGLYATGRRLLTIGQ